MGWSVLAIVVITSLWGIIAFVRGVIGIDAGQSNNVEIPTTTFIGRRGGGTDGCVADEFGRNGRRKCEVSDTAHNSTSGTCKKENGDTHATLKCQYRCIDGGWIETDDRAQNTC